MDIYRFVAGVVDGFSARSRLVLCKDDNAAMARSRGMTSADGPTDVWQATRHVGQALPEVANGNAPDRLAILCPIEFARQDVALSRPGEAAPSQTPTTLVWSTTADGMLLASAEGYRATVERLLPAANARFLIRKDDGSEATVASGVRASTKEAMAEAEAVAGRLLGFAAANSPRNPSGDPGARRGNRGSGSAL